MPKSNETDIVITTWGIFYNQSLAKSSRKDEGTENKVYTSKEGLLSPNELCPSPYCTNTTHTDGIHIECDSSVLCCIDQKFLINVSSLTIYNLVNNTQQMTCMKIVLDKAHNLRKLRIYGSNITSDLLNSTFSNLHKLEEFDMCKNKNLKDIPSDLFYNMTHLRKIRMSNMYSLSLQSLGNAVQNIRSNNIDTFVIDYVGPHTLHTLKPEFFYSLRKSPLKNLVLANLGITHFEHGFTKYIKSISCLILTASYFPRKKIAKLETLLEIIALPKLRVVDLSDLYIHRPDSFGELDDICREPLNKSTEIQEIDQSLIDETEQRYPLCNSIFEINHNVHYLYMHDWHNVAKIAKHSSSVCIAYNNHVRYIDFSNSNLRLRSGLYGLLRLQYANLQNTGIDKLRCKSFCWLPSMNTLLLGRNTLLSSWFEGGNATYALTTMNNLSSIDLAACKIANISRTDFETLTRIKYVNISSNKLEAPTLNHSIDFHFRFLNLRDNFITYLPMNFRISFNKIILKLKNKSEKQSSNLAIDLSRYPLPVIDLSTNPLQCSCDSAEFIKWFKINSRHFYNHSQYSCQFKSHLYKLITFDISLIGTCETNNKNSSQLGQIIGGTFGLLVFLFLAFTSYRYKNNLQYYLYFLPYVKLNLLRYSMMIHPYTVLPEESTNEHDVFILCSGQDKQLVLEKIKPELEKRFKVTDDDDFVPGKPITEGIIQGLSSSSCALLVLSSNFLNSAWLDFEVTMAIAMKLKVIVVKLDEPPHRLLSPALIYLFRKHEARLQYPKSEERLAKFFHKLAVAINAMKNRETRV